MCAWDMLCSQQEMVELYGYEKVYGEPKPASPPPPPTPPAKADAGKVDSKYLNLVHLLVRVWAHVLGLSPRMGLRARVKHRG